MQTLNFPFNTSKCYLLHRLRFTTELFGDGQKNRGPFPELIYDSNQFSAFENVELENGF